MRDAEEQYKEDLANGLNPGKPPPGAKVICNGTSRAYVRPEFEAEFRRVEEMLDRVLPLYKPQAISFAEAIGLAILAILFLALALASSAIAAAFFEAF